MSYYIYAKPETVQVTYKTDYYKQIMKLIWTAILLVSNVNNALVICAWCLDITIPTWLCVALLINLIVSYKAWEVINECN